MEPIEFTAINNLPWWLNNVIKYIMRYDAKDGLQDLYKARSYLEMKIRQLEGIDKFWEKPVQEQRSCAASEQRSLSKPQRIAAEKLTQPEWLKQTQAYKEHASREIDLLGVVPTATYCRCGVNVTSKGFACWDDDCVHKQGAPVHHGETCCGDAEDCLAFGVGCTGWPDDDDCAHKQKPSGDKWWNGMCWQVAK
jgi:hypothetical protein